MEGYLTFWKDPKSVEKAKIYKKNTGLEYDTRSKTQAYKDLKKIKNNVTIRVTPLNFINKKSSIYPLSGIANAEVSEDLFSMEELSSGYLTAGGHEGSCGEGSCGGDKKKDGEGSCGDDKKDGEGIA